MKDISSFKNIKIKMEKDPEKTPFVYATYDTYKGAFSIRTGKLINGQMPKDQADEIETWILVNEEELMRTWNRL